MYRKIETSIWSDPKVRGLDSHGKLLFVYLITNNHAHVSGIYYIPRLIAKHETGLADRVLDRVSDTLSRLGLAHYDTETEVVWVVNMLRYQGRGEKLLRAAARQVESLHNSFLISKFIESYPAVDQFLNDRVSDRVSLARAVYQEQEQEQEQEQDPPPIVPPTGDGARTKDVQKVIAHWNQYADLRKARSRETHERSIKTALGRFTVDEIFTAITNYAAWFTLSRDRPGEFRKPYPWALGEFLSREQGKQVERFSTQGWERTCELFQDRKSTRAERREAARLELEREIANKTALEP